MIFFIDSTNIFIMIICTLLTALCIWLWKDSRILVNTRKLLSDTPPDNSNSAEAGLFFKGYARKKDVYSLFLYLAAEQYIELVDEMAKNWNPSGPSVTIKKLKEYDGNNCVEREFMARLFAVKDVVTEDELKYCFFAFLQPMLKLLNQDKNIEELYKKRAVFKRKTIMIVIPIIYLITVLRPFIKYLKMISVPLFLSFMPLFLCATIMYYYNRSHPWGEQERIYIGAASISYILLGSALLRDSGMLITHLFGILCILIVFLINRSFDGRTPQGSIAYKKAAGFRNHLKNITLEELLELSEQDPKRFYQYLAYAYTYDMQWEWYEKLDIIAQKDVVVKDIYPVLKYPILLSLIKHVMGTIENSINKPGKNNGTKFNNYSNLAEKRLKERGYL